MIATLRSFLLGSVLISVSGEVSESVSSSSSLSSSVSDASDTSGLNRSHGGVGRSPSDANTYSGGDLSILSDSTDSISSVSSTRRASSATAGIDVVLRQLLKEDITTKKAFMSAGDQIVSGVASENEDDSSDSNDRAKPEYRWRWWRPDLARTMFGYFVESDLVKSQSSLELSGSVAFTNEKAKGSLKLLESSADLVPSTSNDLSDIIPEFFYLEPVERKPLVPLRVLSSEGESVGLILKPFEGSFSELSLNSAAEGVGSKIPKVLTKELKTLYTELANYVTEPTTIEKGTLLSLILMVFEITNPNKARHGDQSSKTLGSVSSFPGKTITWVLMSDSPYSSREMKSVETFEWNGELLDRRTNKLSESVSEWQEFRRLLKTDPFPDQNSDFFDLWSTVMQRDAEFLEKCGVAGYSLTALVKPTVSAKDTEDAPTDDVSRVRIEVPKNLDNSVNKPSDTGRKYFDVTFLVSDYLESTSRESLGPKALKKPEGKNRVENSWHAFWKESNEPNGLTKHNDHHVDHLDERDGQDEDVIHADKDSPSESDAVSIQGFEQGPISNPANYMSRFMRVVPDVIFSNLPFTGPSDNSDEVEMTAAIDSFLQITMSSSDKSKSGSIKTKSKKATENDTEGEEESNDGSSAREIQENILDLFRSAHYWCANTINPSSVDMNSLDASYKTLPSDPDFASVVDLVTRMGSIISEEWDGSSEAVSAPSSGGTSGVNNPNSRDAVSSTPDSEMNEISIFCEDKKREFSGYASKILDSRGNTKQEIGLGSGDVNSISMEANAGMRAMTNGERQPIVPKMFVPPKPEVAIVHVKLNATKAGRLPYNLPRMSDKLGRRQQPIIFSDGYSDSSDDLQTSFDDKIYHHTVLQIITMWVSLLGVIGVTLALVPRVLAEKVECQLEEIEFSSSAGYHHHGTLPTHHSTSKRSQIAKKRGKHFPWNSIQEFWRPHVIFQRQSKIHPLDDAVDFEDSDDVFPWRKQGKLLWASRRKHAF